MRGIAGKHDLDFGLVIFADPAFDDGCSYARRQLSAAQAGKHALLIGLQHHTRRFLRERARKRRRSALCPRGCTSRRRARDEQIYVV